jgi:hypothetical protein
MDTDFYYVYAQDRMRELHAEAYAARLTPSFRSRLAHAFQGFASRLEPKRARPSGQAGPKSRTPQRSL